MTPVRDCDPVNRPPLHILCIASLPAMLQPPAHRQDKRDNVDMQSCQSVQPCTAGGAAAEARDAVLRCLPGHARVVVPPQLRHRADVVVSKEGDGVEECGARPRQQHRLRGDVGFTAVVEVPRHVSDVFAVNHQVLYVMRNCPW